MWDVALSTMWSIGRFKDLRDFFSVGQQLGFEKFELNHSVNSKMLNSVDLGRYCIPSIHEPCPADISTATLKQRGWLASSLDQDCRQQGVRAVQRSIDLAQKIGATVLVFHLGRVDIDPQVERELWRLFEAGQAQTPEYDEAKEGVVAARAAKVAANLDAARQSLLELTEYAGRAGVRLALENRYHYLDIPLPDEMEMLLELTGDGRVGFCYDVGHAQTLDHLGLVPHEEWLKRYQSYMIEVHLHGIRGLKDHVATGLDEVDWDSVAAHLSQGAIRTCEVRAFNTPEQITAAMQFLVEKGCVSQG